MTDCVDGAGGPGLASLRGQAGLRMEEVVATAGRSTGWHARHGRAAARVSLSGGLGKTEAGLALCVEGNGLGDSEDSASCESLLEHFFVVFDLLFDFKLLRELPNL